ncbi:MAG: DUF2207 domain-containing protein [Propionibacteriaceae bacterium]|nr:DUF2207 domain-containing protein [Propionibacteriaceae bacterium]
MIWASILAVATVVVAILRIVVAIRSKDAPGNETVAVAFAPPRALTPGLAAQLRRDVKDNATIPAEILDLALKGVWQVGVRDDADAGRPGQPAHPAGRGTKTWFVQRATLEEPELEPVPQQVYRAIFPPGSTALTADLVAGRETRLGFTNALHEAWHTVTRRGWVEHLASAGLGIARAGAWLVPMLAFVAFLGGPDAGALPLLAFAFLGGLATNLIKVSPWRLTTEGRRLNDELDGLKHYMTLAEADRLKVLQAPDTATRLPAVQGSGEIARLHERLLPYAVLFGILPQWSEVVAHDLEDADLAPAWFFLPGLDPFTFMAWAAFADAGGLAALGDMGSFDADVGADTGMEGIGDGGDMGGDFGDGGGADGGGGDGGGGFFGGDGGGDGGGLFDGFDF